MNFASHRFVLKTLPVWSSCLTEERISLDSNIFYITHGLMSDSCNSTFILVTTKIYLNQGSNHLCYQIQRSLFWHQCLREHQYACDKCRKKHKSIKNYFIFLIHYEEALDKALGKATWEVTEIKVIPLFWSWASCMRWILICVFFCTDFWAVEKIKWFDRAVILLSLRPASLMHIKIPKDTK